DRKNIVELAAVAVALLGSCLLLAQRVRTRNAAANAHERLIRSADEVAVRIATADAALRAEARGIVDLKVVRAAIETDADTVRDLAEADATFRLGPNVAIEVLQIRDQHESLLLRVPATAPPLPPHGGVRIHPDGSIWITARAPIVPLYG